MAVLSGLIVSVDAFFIGISLGLQKKCRFFYLAIINLFLLVLCILGFLLAALLYDFFLVDAGVIELNILIGFSFILLGLWYIFGYLFSRREKNKKNFSWDSRKKIIPVGLVMSIEAMLITMGITLIFLPGPTLAIPITVALAHFGYSTISFFLMRTKYVKKIPVALSRIISGLALIVYGLMALFL